MTRPSVSSNWSLSKPCFYFPTETERQRPNPSWWLYFKEWLSSLWERHFWVVGDIYTSQRTKERSTIVFILFVCFIFINASGEGGQEPLVWSWLEQMAVPLSAFSFFPRQHIKGSQSSQGLRLLDTMLQFGQVS